MRKIRGESELASTAPLKSREFIRSLCTPTVIIDSRSGECFEREDGQNWEYPAYRIWEGKVTPLTAKDDGAIYPYSEKAAA